ncbi:MAG: hypothetical protein BalsKO_09290 [Balneolaceae bacterium]
MKKITFISFALLLTAVVTINFIKLQQEEEVIKEVIKTGYIHGAFNELNPEAMATTFHKDFAIFSPGRDGEIRRYPIASWIENTKSTKESDDFNPEENVWDHEFSSVDVTGNSAAVKLELYHEGKHVYTDYLSLLKFEDGWKIVAKVYHQH